MRQRLSGSHDEHLLSSGSARDQSRLLLALVLLIYTALAIWYSLIIPLGEAPDEVPHFTYIRHLSQHRRLPTTTEEHEAWQPPLYYALGAVLTFWIDDEPDAPFVIRANADFDVADPRAPKNLLLHTADEAWPFRGWALAWHLVRLLSMTLGAITVWAIYRLGSVLVPRQPAIPLTMAALAAFTPQFLFLSAVANNDNAALTFSALILWQVAALVHNADGSPIWRRAVVLGLLLGLGLLSKASLITLLPIVGLAFIIVAGMRYPLSSVNRRFLLVASWLAVTMVVAGLAAGWFFLRNWRLYGDPMGWSFLRQTHALREGPLTLDVMVWLFRGVFRSFWLGWIGIEFDEMIYWIISIVFWVGLLGFGIWLVQRWRTLGSPRRWTLSLLGLHAAITLGSLVQWTATVLGTDQGRLIYPVLPTVMLFLTLGWRWWIRGKRGPWVLGGLAAAMLVLAILTPIRYIAPVHAPAPVASEAELAAATPLGVDWNGIRLLGYRLEASEVQPGAKLVLHLYWQGLEEMDDDVMALIQLVNEEGRFLMYTEGSPTAGRDTTDRWRLGVRLASRHLLPIPDYGQPGDYQLTISLHPFGESAWLPAYGPDGAPLGDRLVLPETVRITVP